MIYMTVTQLKQCVDDYGKDIYGFCIRITGSVQEGEELYQDTFLKALELVKKIDYNKNPKSYLLSISVCLWKNRKRKYAWRQRIAETDNRILTEHAEETAAKADMPEELLLTKEQNLFIRQCVRELPPKYQVPICLYYSAELSISEISSCLKIPEGTVKSRLYKARTIIKEKLEVAGYDK